MTELPVVDITALRAPGTAAHATEALAEVAARIDRACRTNGFFLVSGHGVDHSLLAEVDRQARGFFALPEATKAQIAMAHGGVAWRGWFPEGGELTSGQPDHKEGLYFGTELAADDPRVLAGRPLHGPNLFPAEPAGLRPAVLSWIDQVTELGHVLARGVALGLGLDSEWFDRHLTADPTVLFRIFRYPALTADASGWSVGEHTDYGLLTLLAHDGKPGLQVHSAGGWLDVPEVPGTFVVNLGDMLERMTAGRYHSTPHRVRHVAGAGAIDRLSFPLFFDPGWDAEILPVPEATFDREDRPQRARWDGTSVHEWSGTYGDYLTAKVARVFPALGDAVLG